MSAKVNYLVFWLHSDCPVCLEYAEGSHANHLTGHSALYRLTFIHINFEGES